MVEHALVFDREGRTLHWHIPVGRTTHGLPDSRALWDVLWAERLSLGGVAHTHPFAGPATPSLTDLTTFAACEAALGRRLVWVIATWDAEAHWVWCGPARLDYGETNTGLKVAGLTELRAMSGEGGRR